MWLTPTIWSSLFIVSKCGNNVVAPTIWSSLFIVSKCGDNVVDPNNMKLIVYCIQMWRQCGWPRRYEAHCLLYPKVVTMWLPQQYEAHCLLYPNAVTMWLTPILWSSLFIVCKSGDNVVTPTIWSLLFVVLKICNTMRSCDNCNFNFFLLSNVTENDISHMTRSDFCIELQ